MSGEVRAHRDRTGEHTLDSGPIVHDLCIGEAQNRLAAQRELGVEGHVARALGRA